MPDLIAIADIAKRLDLEVTTVRRLIARESENLGLQVQRRKGDKLFLSPDDVEKLIACYQIRRGPISANSAEISAYDRCGYFYLIQLVPEALPNRVKIGYADNVEKRLAEHRTAAPTAKLIIKAWPCKRSWDYAAMDSITRTECKLVLNEVFEGEITEFLRRAESFFSVMPNPDCEKELSEHSPLYEPRKQPSLDILTG